MSLIENVTRIGYKCTTYEINLIRNVEAVLVLNENARNRIVLDTGWKISTYNIKFGGIHIEMPVFNF